MPEEVTTEEKKPEVASRGKVETIIPGTQPVNKEVPQKEKEAEGIIIEDKAGTAALEMTEEQLKAFFEKQGMKYEGLDKLKEKVNYEVPAQTVELTKEQKEEQAKAEEKRVLDFYIANGGTAESYVAIKNILLSEDLTSLTVTEIKADMKKEGFNDEEIETVLKERYYQIKTEEIVQGDEEEDADFAARKAQIEKKVAYGAKKIANRSSIIKTKAEGFFTGLKDAIKAEDLLKQEEIQLQSNVDEVLAKLPRKLTFELGKSDNIDLPPVQHEIAEESIAKVSALLKDPEKRKQFLFNQDDSLNVAKLAEIMVRNEELERIAKLSLLEGQSRQVKIFKEVFPSHAQDLGVGGSSAPVKVKTGNVTQRGKPVRV